ncbi:MAG: hypothetical protein KME21_14180 [Desmonostoc vinosum HA7617-LM4]|nr:hypothetical protein [Desmonostoc vinosum HA7617-LM4]
MQRRRFALDISNAFFYFQRLIEKCVGVARRRHRLIHFPFVGVDSSQFVQRRRFALDISNAFFYFQRLIVECVGVARRRHRFTTLGVDPDSFI